MRKKHRDTLARSAMKLLCTLLGIILALMLAVTCAFQYLLDQINTVPDSDAGSLPAFSLSQKEGRSPLSMITGEHQTVNILLIGQDRREGETQARSDSMILCSYSRDTAAVTMTSFLRDLYLPIPGHGSNRINAAYSFGGMKLLEQTIEENFAISVDGSIEVDFQQFSQIIDLLGGVSITLRQDEAEIINQETGSMLAEGTHTLTGSQALTYSRIRSLDLDGDFSRTNRQRKVLEAIVDSCRNASPAKLIPLLNQLLPMITTNLNSGQLLLLALEAAPQLSDLQLVSQRIPADGTFSDDTIDGMSVLVADLEANRRILHEIVN
ncbi:MAG: LCP family protein [Oscillospiraceae bacterium]|nr:LCP family protein [Oscillospiraceae bacterium]